MKSSGDTVSSKIEESFANSRQAGAISSFNKKLLARRAEVLAKPFREELTDKSITVLHFQLAYEQYAMETKYIKEVLFIKAITPLPLTPKYVLGVVNVYGEIISALDIRKFFNLPGEPVNDLNRLLVLQDNEMTFGILVDRIREIVDIPVNRIMKTNISLTGIHSNYILGLTEEKIIVLDGSVLINDPAIIINQS